MEATGKGADAALFLTRPGGRIGYAIDGSGPLVVCVPGMGDLRSVYRFLAPALVEAGFRVAAMDSRGHGDSDATFASYDDVAAGGDILALVEHLGGPAVLVGNSMAAGAATWAAAEAPSSVTGLVLVGPFVRNPPTSAVAMLGFRLALLRPWGRAVWKSYYGSQYPGRRPPDLAKHLAWIDAALRLPGHWRSFVATTHTSHAPVEARLSEVNAPVLVVMGERDRDPRSTERGPVRDGAARRGDPIGPRGRALPAGRVSGSRLTGYRIVRAASDRRRGDRAH